MRFSKKTCGLFLAGFFMSSKIFIDVFDWNVAGLINDSIGIGIAIFIGFMYGEIDYQHNKIMDDLKELRIKIKLRQEELAKKK